MSVQREETKYEIRLRRAKEQLESYKQLLDELNNRKQKLANKDHDPNILDVMNVGVQLDKIIDLAEDIGERVQQKADLTRELTQQTHTIRKTIRRQMEVSKICVEEIWKEVERGSGNAKAIVSRCNGRISTVRIITELWYESNAGEETILSLDLSVEDTRRKCKVTWYSGFGPDDHTKIEIFESGDQAHTRMRNLVSILKKYETEGDFGRWFRICLKWIILLAAGAFVFNFVTQGLGEPASCITFLSEQAFAPQNTRFWSRRRVWFQFTVGEDKPPML